MAVPSARDQNRARVIDVVVREAPVTRERIISRTKLSKATVARVVEELRLDGYLTDGPLEEGEGRGRRSTAMELHSNLGYAVGIDLGVRTTRLLVADLRGRVQNELTTPSETELGADTLVEWLNTQIDDVTRGLPGALRAIGIGVPGRVIGGREIYQPAPRFNVLEGVGFVEEFRKAAVPILVNSDADMALLGEIAAASIDGIKNSVLFSVSTEFNVARSMQGRLVQGTSASYGELRLLPGVRAGMNLGELLSVNGLQRTADTLGADLDAEALEAMWKTPQQEPELVELFTEGLCTAIATVTVVADPDVVVFNGRLLPLIEAVLPEVERRLTRRLPSVPRLHPTTLSGFAGARGAVHAAVGQAHVELRHQILTRRRSDANE